MPEEDAIRHRKALHQLLNIFKIFKIKSRVKDPSVIKSKQKNMSKYHRLGLWEIGNGQENQEVWGNFFVLCLVN